jgi:hypothetical protein
VDGSPASFAGIPQALEGRVDVGDEETGFEGPVGVTLRRAGVVELLNKYRVDFGEELVRFRFRDDDPLAWRHFNRVAVGVPKIRLA